LRDVGALNSNPPSSQGLKPIKVDHKSHRIKHRRQSIYMIVFLRGEMVKKKKRGGGDIMQEEDQST
jgi:hypothetical protein